MLLAVDEIALVTAAVGKIVAAFPVISTLFPLPLVAGSIGPGIDAPAVGFPIQQLAGIFRLIGQEQFAARFSSSSVKSPAKFFPVRESQCPRAVGQAFFNRAHVSSSIRIGIDALFH